MSTTDMTNIERILNNDGELIGPRLPVPRWRYFQKNRGPMFAWTTERFENRYGSFVMVPVGRGSRSGQAEEWVVDEESIASHELRKDAKARALRLFKSYAAGDARPWR